MIETLREMEAARQEMKREAFINAMAASPNFEFETDLIFDAEVSRAYAAEMHAIRVEADRKHYFEN